MVDTHHHYNRLTTYRRKRSFFRLHKKDEKYNVVPAHHVAQGYIDDYLEAGDFASDRTGSLPRTSDQGLRQDVLLRKAMARQTAIKMIKRRALYAGLLGENSNYSFRGRVSQSICVTAVIWKPLHASLDMSRLAPHNSTIA